MEHVVLTLLANATGSAGSATATTTPPEQYIVDRHAYDALRSLGALGPMHLRPQVAEICEALALAAGATLSADQASGIQWTCDRMGVPSPALVQARMDELPFRVLPGLCRGMVAFDALMEEVNFNRDTVVTASGKVVPERRSTAWQGTDL